MLKADIHDMAILQAGTIYEDYDGLYVVGPRTYNARGWWFSELTARILGFNWRKGDADDAFFVYEREDLIALRNLVDEAIRVSDRPH